MAFTPKELLAMMHGDAEASQAAPDLNKLGEVGKLAKELVAAQGEMERLQILVDEQSEKIRKLSELDIPALLEEMQIYEVKLDTGHKLKLVTSYKGHISDTRREEACKWMVEKGFSDLIKTEISLKFGKGEDDQIKVVKAVLSDSGFTFVIKEAVHPMTLNAFLKERMQSGEEFPSELFGAHLVKKAEIKNK